MKLGAVEAEPAWLAAVGIGGHLVLRLADDPDDVGAVLAEAGQGRELSPGEDLRAVQRRARVLHGLPGQVQTAIPEGAEVSFRGLPDLVVAQVLFGLQQRCRDGALTQHTRLRALTSWLRAARVSSLDALSAEEASGTGVDRLTRGPLTTMIAAVRRARVTSESEYANDRWDMAALGMSGYVDFGGISQPWLKETAKRWVRHAAPQRRGERAGNNLRSQVLYLDLLSQSLRRGLTGGTTRPAWAGRTSPPAASSSAAVSSG